MTHQMWKSQDFSVGVGPPPPPYGCGKNSGCPAWWQGLYLLSFPTDRRVYFYYYSVGSRERASAGQRTSVWSQFSSAFALEPKFFKLGTSGLSNRCFPH